MSHEINLLPRDRRERLHRDAIRSIIRALLGHVIGGLSLLSVVGIGLTVILAVIGMQLEVTSSDDLDVAIEEYQDVRTRVLLHNVQWQILTSAADADISWFETLQNVFAAVPNGVHIRSITAQADTIDGAVLAGRLEVVGQSDTRALLDLFIQELEGLSRVNYVTSPTSNLLSPINTAFQITVHVDSPAPPPGSFLPSSTVR